MKKLFFYFVIIGLILLSCAACNPQNSIASPVESSTPTPTEPSTFTPTMSPTPTATPTLTPTPKPVILTLRTIPVVEGGFSFRAPEALELDFREKQVGLYDQAGEFMISIFGETGQEDLNPDTIVDDFLSTVGQQGNGELVKSNPQELITDNIEGKTFEINGNLGNYTIQGQAFIAVRNASQYVFGMGFSKSETGETSWLETGQRAFTAMFGTVKFLEPLPNADTCVIATDNTYGYSQDNPIKVGGDIFDGPVREETYLNHLRGPNGEMVTFERAGSEPYGEIILDRYNVSYPGIGQIAVLYLDMYTYEQLLAPVGFTCESPFPISTP